MYLAEQQLRENGPRVALDEVIKKYRLDSGDEG
jgi:hypothetical protein